jgi:hypothetical protein
VVKRVLISWGLSPKLNVTGLSNAVEVVAGTPSALSGTLIRSTCVAISHVAAMLIRLVLPLLMLLKPIINVMLPLLMSMQDVVHRLLSLMKVSKMQRYSRIIVNRSPEVLFRRAYVFIC